ncbi:DNA-binding transcriptional regulator LsrR (DeoR family) [Rhodobium orientis]|uniref:DNA-binding transcriptional regulator n=1 Tax=Rhodobium orientis TaxID=34017 RepID=A0A327JGH6_9HYPH|nr:sugar-binding transcriptional regulator [Rhodobium orientis]MBB4302650.1 DNA-binding transcriptional regulator LsrR (DeoR family) [Rhodobium orientis]MBK5948433.1 DNA-binding transcriptional regulator [Rhodobium orientis]RAI23974.1 DNA-binding transcriptional regulator [Rhodobium orientis]
MARINELRLIARVAQMYHVENKRQAEIARHLRLSQATVSRMLKRAQDEGIVRTTIAAPSGTYGDLETGLRERFNLPEAIVVECAEDRDGAIMARIGEAAAHFLEVTLQTGEVIGVSSWSETILKMVDNIHPMKTGKAKYVVQTLGGMGNPAVQTHATQLTTRLAKLTGAEPRLLSAQGVAQSREAKLVMLSDPYVRETIDLFSSITLAIIGIGAVEPSRMLASSGNVFSAGELSDVAEAGAVGDMSLRFFDKDGRMVKTPLDDRVIGMDMAQLGKVERVIALAGGKSKTRAIAGALKTGVLSMLITDKFTAARLLDREQEFEEGAEVA